MALQRRSRSAPPAGFIRLRCERLEDRVAPALFNVQTPLSFTGLNNNGCVATADLNKDGLTDAVMSNFGTNYASGAGTTISVLYARDDGTGQWDGGFIRVNLSTGGQNVSFVAIADIDGDSWADVVACNANRQNVGSVSVFANDGAGNLSLVGTPFSTFGNNSSWVGLHDVTGDGELDAIVASFGRDTGNDDIEGNNVTIFQGNGDFTFSGGPITTLAPEIQFVPTALAVADFDLNGILDIAAAVPGVPPDFGEPYPDGNVYVFPGTGSGGFGDPNLYETGGVLPVNIQAARLNADARPDLIIANAGDPNDTPEFSGDAIGVLLNVSNPGNVNFGIPTSLTANTYGPFAVSAVDYNLDGKTDIAAVNYGSQVGSPAAFVSVYMGNGTGGFTTGSPGTYNTQTSVGGGQYLAPGDFDANGVPDLIVAHASNKVGLLLNTTTPVPQLKSVLVNGTTLAAETHTASRLTTLKAVFNTPISAADAGAFTLVNTFTGAVLSNAAGGGITVFGLGTTTLTLAFTGAAGVEYGSLEDGIWVLTTNLAKVKNANNAAGSGTVNTNHIRRLFGDVNTDGTVDGTDFSEFGNTFGLSAGDIGFLDALDFDANGTIDGVDFGEFGNRFGSSL